MEINKNKHEKKRKRKKIKAFLFQIKTSKYYKAFEIIFGGKYDNKSMNI